MIGKKYSKKTDNYFIHKNDSGSISYDGFERLSDHLAKSHLNGFLKNILCTSPLNDVVTASMQLSSMQTTRKEHRATVHCFTAF